MPREVGSDRATLDGSRALCGRDDILTELIPECLGYPNRRAANRKLPVITLLGPRASGKTERLKQLSRDYAGKVPCTWIDLGDSTYRDSITARPLPRKVLLKVSFDLGEHRKHFGRLKFPRLTLGLLAVSSPVDLGGRGRALDDIKKILDSDDSVMKVKEVLDELPEIVRSQQIVAMPPGADTVLVLAVRHLAPIVLRRLVLRRAKSWYGRRVPEGSENGYDALIRLNHMDRRDEKRHLVDEILFEAFLADLSANFNRGLGHWDRVFNCLALLDNVDSPVGESFLRLLHRARHEPAPPMRTGCDPLVVVGARRHRQHGGDDKALREAQLDDVGSRRSPAGQSCHRESGSYLVELGDLTLEEVERAVEEARLPATPEGLARFTHRLTAGHRGTVRLVVDAVKGELERNRSALDLRKLLDLPVPVAHLGSEPNLVSSLCVGGRALDGLLAGMTAGQRRDLVTCAGARDIVAAASLEAPGVVSELDKILRDDLWVTGNTPQGQRQLVAHRLLHRLLLWELGRRTEHADNVGPRAARDREVPGWTAVHAWLRDYHRESGDQIASLHCTLALGDFSPVARFFDGTFREGRIGQWLSELNTVTVAPNRLHTQPHLSDRSPFEQVEVLCQDLPCRSPRGKAIARLAAAKWILADPLTVPDSRTVSLIVVELDHLAHERNAGREFMVLYDEARRYQEVKETWRL